MEPTDPDPQHWFLDFFIFNLEFLKRSKFFAASYKNPYDLLILRLQFFSGSGSKSKIGSRPIWQFKQKTLTKLYSIVSQKVVISFLI